MSNIMNKVHLFGYSTKSLRDLHLSTRWLKLKRNSAMWKMHVSWRQIERNDWNHFYYFPHIFLRSNFSHLVCLGLFFSHFVIMNFRIAHQKMWPNACKQRRLLHQWQHLMRYRRFAFSTRLLRHIQCNTEYGVQCTTFHPKRFAMRKI